MSLSNYSENLVLNWLLTNGSATRPTAWYVSLHYADPGETGDNEFDTGDDSSYARKSATFAAASSGATSNTGALTWTMGTVTGTPSVTHVAVWDALTTGNCLGIGQLYSPVAVATSSVVSFAIGDLSVSLD